jgi:hypothetical protein
MAYLITQLDVLNRLHNLLGHRVNPGGTDDDLKRYCQDGFDYAWRYYKWGWAMKTATTLSDGILPTDFDLDGYSDLDTATYTVTWDGTQLVLSPAAAITIVYQTAPPTLTADVGVPFPSARVVALGAFIYAKKGENPTRADVKQEWDLFHNELNKLAGRAYNNTGRTRPVHYLDSAGTFVGDVGA